MKWLNNLVLSLTILGLAASLTSITYAQKASTRTWRDASGQFSVNATLVRVSEATKSVRLRREDGVELNVPIELLSDQDRDFLKKRSEPADPKAPETPATTAGSTSNDGMVLATVELENGATRYSRPGFAIRRVGDETFVATVQSHRDGRASRECMLSWYEAGERRDTTGEWVADQVDFGKWLFKGPAAELPKPLPAKTPDSLKEDAEGAHQNPENIALHLRVASPSLPDARPKEVVIASSN